MAALCAAVVIGRAGLSPRKAHRIPAGIPLRRSAAGEWSLRKGCALCGDGMWVLACVWCGVGVGWRVDGDADGLLVPFGIPFNPWPACISPLTGTQAIAYDSRTQDRYLRLRVPGPAWNCSLSYHQSQAPSLFSQAEKATRSHGRRSRPQQLNHHTAIKPRACTVDLAFHRQISPAQLDPAGQSKCQLATRRLPSLPQSAQTPAPQTLRTIGPYRLRAPPPLLRPRRVHLRQSRTSLAPSPRRSATAPAAARGPAALRSTHIPPPAQRRPGRSRHRRARCLTVLRTPTATRARARRRVRLRATVLSAPVRVVVSRASSNASRMAGIAMM